MKIGLLTYYVDGTPTEKIEKSAASFRAKFNREADTVMVHPDTAPEGVIGNVAVRHSVGILVNHLWIGIEGDE